MASVYLKPYPWLGYMQAMALGSSFLLLCQFISGDYQTEVSLFFAAFAAPQKKNKPQVSGLEWFRKQWIAIFQYQQHRTLLCAHLGISTALAVTSVINSYSALKQNLTSHQSLAKLLLFKLIVGLSFIEKIIFMILRSTGFLKESPTLSYADVNIGIPNMVSCVQMVPFALFFPYAWNVAPYFISRQNLALPASRTRT
ncbi:hypothetical protein BDV23DRAFT_182266 [Aspergillus alliaceus]|uniref:Uncharacterized protein n=1 Tax=Petromyces alliaceus TaxID=209559 RepID=A0A5N7CD86_PETAA|nr:hypothetical protein BDV23DRAFT_182266 [Aspergillus alliaceus]